MMEISLTIFKFEENWKKGGRVVRILLFKLSHLIILMWTILLFCQIRVWIHISWFSKQSDSLSEKCDSLSKQGVLLTHVLGYITFYFTFSYFPIESYIYQLDISWHVIYFSGYSTRDDSSALTRADNLYQFTRFTIDSPH